MNRRLLLILASLGACASVHAANPLGGLTVAVSSDGTRLVAGGDTRTILVIDPKTLEVKERHWVEVSITGLAFNADASVLAVEETSDSVRLYSTSDWKKKAEIAKCQGFASAGDVFAGHDGNSRGGPEVAVYSFADGSKKTSFTLPDGTRIASLGLSADGKTVAVLSEGEKDSSEKEVPYGQLPKDLKGMALEEFKQKNDGKTSTIFLYDATSGKELSSAKIYFTTGTNTRMIFSGENVLAINYNNINASITPKGEVKIFQLENSFNYGIGFTADRQLILTGGLRSFSMTLSENLAATTGSIDKIAGWPEYWKGFSGIKGGDAIYGATSGYRIFRLTGEGKILKGEPVR